MNRSLKIYLQKAKNYLWHLPKSLFYSLYYGFPSRKLTLIAVTGTDGKTTTVNLLHHLLQQSGVRAGSISTLGARIGDRSIRLGLHTTSPDPKIVQKIFRQMVEEGITHVVVEVTAHALDQFRFFGCHFRLGAITNTSHEHLDDFLSMEHYISTKAKLFRYCQTAIFNRDDDSYSTLINLYPTKAKTYSTHHPADYRATDIKIAPQHLSFKINGHRLLTNSRYLYQVSNILVAYAIIDTLGLDTDLVARVVKDFPQMKGRREEVDAYPGIRCLVDFAHTPAALAATISSVKSTTKGKTIVIFGATGGRDPSKRPLMGQIVSQIADVGIITADDTRNEKVEDINQQIINGLDPARLKKQLFTYYNISNRQDAFNLAAKLAKVGDSIIACGKGHETTILHGKTEYPWSESEAFRAAFRYLEENQ